MPFETHTPFRWRDGHAAGLSNNRLNSSAFRKLVRGVFIDSRVDIDALVEARAAVLVAGAHSFVSHHTAARLYGCVVPDEATLHASVPPGRSRSDHPDVAVHRSRRVPQTFRGVPVTSPVDTFLDLATSLGLVDLVVLGDSLVKRRRTTPEKLLAAARSARGRGCRLARRAASLVRTGVDSPMETRSRLLRVLSGLPELETDIRFHDPVTQALLRRLDAGDRATRTAVEYDGKHHVQRQEQWESDITRREEFDDEEWRIVTLISKDIYNTPGDTVRRLERILRRRGMRFGPLKDEWRLHFRGHG
ncbi:hypothetical protein [Ornithinimicrobium cavernae]|uniref:hypothetical protein n=1 Tax=Ornithinimicrobium cavernae TaxID=2666047 RepID=UPI00137A00F1|nr:hypothetical protein [Ornithinimicrobium cavernae]